MKDRSPFGLAGLWEDWRSPTTGEWERTVAIITVPSNDLVAQIHDRMPRSSNLEATTVGCVSKLIRTICSLLIRRANDVVADLDERKQT